MPVRDESGDEVQGWVDFYQGWQAFQLHDLLQAARLHAPLLNTPDAPARAANLSQRIDDFRRLSNGWIERVGRDWAARRTAFEHLYRYRTLLGIWMGREGTLRQRQGGARQLARQLGLDAPSLKNEIRDVLLVAWRDLSELPASARERLRSDINIAVEWLSVLEGRPVDTFDEFWDPADPNPREWKRLPEVLPFELDAARHEFGRRATHYLQRFNSYMPAPRRYDEARITLLIQRHWIKSLSVRRFCLAFLRLHKHYGGAVNRDRDVQLVAESPVDFLVLSTLYAEKLQAELFLAGRRVPLDPVKDLVLLRARQIAVAWNLPGLESRVDKAWRKSTALHTLTSTRRTPFRLARRRSHEEYLADTLLTFGKLRNYCAHHDILDWKLLNTKVGAPAIEALVLTVLLTLDP